MKMQALEYFVALVDAGSISKAAQQLYVAQPSLTKCLHLLEAELGFDLVVRTSTGVQLTPNGRRVYLDAKQILAYCAGWRELAKQDQLRQIDLYTYLSFPDFLLPDIVLGLCKEYPELTINLTVSERPEAFLSRSTSKPVLVLAMCRDDEHMHQLARVQGNTPVVLMKGGYRCLVNTRHPLARRTSVSLWDLRRFFLILPKLEEDPPTAGLPTSFLECILRQNPDQKKVDVQTVANVIPLVEKDDDSFALSFWPAARRYPGVQEGRLVAVPIRDECAFGQFVLFYSKQACAMHPAVQRMAQEICCSARVFLESCQKETPRN